MTPEENKPGAENRNINRLSDNTDRLLDLHYELRRSHEKLSVQFQSLSKLVDTLAIGFEHMSELITNNHREAISSMNRRDRDLERIISWIDLDLSHRNKSAHLKAAAAFVLVLILGMLAAKLLSL